MQWQLMDLVALLTNGDMHAGSFVKQQQDQTSGATALLYAVQQALGTRLQETPAFWT